MLGLRAYLIILWCLVLPLCNGEDNVYILWTQKSSIWSSVRGIRGDLSLWLQDGSMSSYYFVRSHIEERSQRYGLAFDHVSNTLCWSDALKYGLFCQPFNNTLSRVMDNVQTVFTDSQLQVHDIAMDWQTGNIYCAAGNALLVAPSRNSRENNIYLPLLWNFDNVTGISIDVNKNMLWWTDRGAHKIYRSTLAGREMTQVSNRARRPIGITCVHAEERVYWVDNEYSRIASLAYSGDPGSYKEHYAQNAPSLDLTGIAVINDHIISTGRSPLQIHLFVKNSNNDEYAHSKSKDIDANPYYLATVQQLSGDPNHECARKGCQDICLNLGDGTGKCTCKAGTYLQADGKSCSARDVRFLYTTGPLLVDAPIDISPYEPSILRLTERALLTGRPMLKALGYHHARGLVYVSDVDDDVIVRCDVETGTCREFEHTVNARHVEGISVDWLAGNVYWSDMELRHIMTSQLDGRYHNVVVENIEEPTGVAVDSKAKFLVWCASRNGNEGIYKADLDGSNLQQIVNLNNNDRNHPQGLFLDPHTQRIYWVEKLLGTISYVDYQGTNQQTINTRVNTNDQPTLYDVAIYQDVSTWSDTGRGLHFRNTLTGQDYQIEATTHNYSNQVFDVIAYDPYLQPHDNNPCQQDNGGCDQLCFPVPQGGRTCNCAIGFQLRSDGKTCSQDKTLDEYFLLFVDPYHKQVYQSNISTLGQPSAAPWGLSLPRMDFPLSVDYDSGKQRLFWIDLERREIRRCNLDGTEEGVVYQIAAGSRPSRLAVDARLGWLYYTDWTRGTVSKMRLDGSDHSDVITDLTHPFAIAVDHFNQTLAWTADDGQVVEVSDTEGADRRTLSFQRSINKVSGLALLQGEQMLYVGDNSNGNIQAYNLSNRANELVYQYSELSQVYSLGVSSDHIYFSVYNKKSVYRIERATGGGLTEVGLPVFARLTDIKVVQAPVVPEYNEDDGFNWIILVAAIAAALLLLIILLAAILGTRRRRKLRQRAASTSANGDLEGHGENNVDRDYAYLDQPYLYDIRHSHDVMNKANGKTTAAPLTNGKSTGFDEVNDHSADVYAGIPDLAVTSLPDVTAQTGNHNEAASVPGLATTVLTAAGATATDKKYNKRNKQTHSRWRKKTLPKDPEFEFSPENKVATRIQRLANRLRNRLSSVRWSQTEKEDGDNVAPGPDDTPTPEVVDAQRVKKLPKAKKGDIPHGLHQMPRGFAPASHCVPQQLKKM